MIRVSKHDKHAFSTIQEAINSVSDDRSEWETIMVEEGVYDEKIFLRKKFLRLIGAGKDKTIIRYGDGAKKIREDGSEYGTFNSATLLAAGSDIVIEDLTIENTAGIGCKAGQALALYLAADRSVVRNCNLIAYQDTLFTGDIKQDSMKRLMLPDFFVNSEVPIHFDLIRNYLEHCFISGDVDYLFGPNTVYFSECEIFSRKLMSEHGSFVTATNTPKEQEYGYVFHNCRFTSDDDKESVYLGRPWRDYAKVAILECELGEHIKRVGWLNWNRPKSEATTCYLEYGNTGLGADTKDRAGFSKHTDNPGIMEYYSMEEVLGGADGWNPKK